MVTSSARVEIASGISTPGANVSSTRATVARSIVGRRFAIPANQRQRQTVTAVCVYGAQFADVVRLLPFAQLLGLPAKVR